MSGEDPVDDPTETLEIQNVVASTEIGHELDLQTVAIDLAGADYDPAAVPTLSHTREVSGDRIRVAISAMSSAMAHHTVA